MTAAGVVFMDENIADIEKFPTENLGKHPLEINLPRLLSGVTFIVEAKHQREGGRRQQDLLPVDAVCRGQHPVAANLRRTRANAAQDRVSTNQDGAASTLHIVRILLIVND